MQELERGPWGGCVKGRELVHKIEESSEREECGEKVQDGSEAIGEVAGREGGREGEEREGRGEV